MVLFRIRSNFSSSTQHKHMFFTHIPHQFIRKKCMCAAGKKYLRTLLSAVFFLAILEVHFFHTGPTLDSTFNITKWSFFQRYANSNKMIQTKKTETIVAKFNLSIVLLTIVWKSIGLDWLPMGLGQAFNSIFDPSDNYYPRHDRHETAYNLFYLLLYGIFGLVAQWSSLKLVHDNNDK